MSSIHFLIPVRSSFLHQLRWFCFFKCNLNLVMQISCVSIQVGGPSSSCYESYVFFRPSRGHWSAFCEIGACIQMLNVESWRHTEVLLFLPYSLNKESSLFVINIGLYLVGIFVATKQFVILWYEVHDLLQLLVVILKNMVKAVQKNLKIYLLPWSPLLVKILENLIIYYSLCELKGNLFFLLMRLSET